MNTNNPLQFLQQGFHITLGATTALVESIQDPQKRQENLAQLRLEFNQLSQLWAEKGQMTEAEARALIDRLTEMASSQMANSNCNRQSGTNTSSSTGVNTPGSSTAANGVVQAELEELIAQLARMRETLEQNRQTNS